MVIICCKYSQNPPYRQIFTQLLSAHFVRSTEGWLIDVKNGRFRVFWFILGAKNKNMLSERSERKSSELRSRRHPDYLMRAQWHDYRRPAAYLVTFTKDRATPRLSYVKGEIINGKAHAQTQLKELGVLVEKEIKELPSLFENLEVLAYAIMPDHVHIVLRVYKYANYTLGRVVAKVKGLVSAAVGSSLWSKGFNDKISFDRDRTANFIRYVNENPLRFYVKSQHPEFFNRRYRIQLNGSYYDIFGNPMLLRHPLRSVVRFSSKFSADELNERRMDWSETIRQQGVLVSPFIHPEEKKVFECGVELGASVILLRDNGFTERFKPEGKLFDLCVEGRLLLVAPLHHETRTAGGITRRQCMELNQLAELLSSSGSVYQREYMR